MMDSLSQFLGILNFILIICSAVGGYFAIRHSRQVAITSIQRETIEALQQQIDTLKDKQEEISKQNTHLEHIISTIQEALKQRGILVTISGDLVTLTDADGTTHTVKRQPTSTLARVQKPRRPARKREGES